MLDQRHKAETSALRARLQRERRVYGLIHAAAFIFVVWVVAPVDGWAWGESFRSNLLVVIGASTWPWVWCVVRYRALLEGLWRVYYFLPGALLVALGCGQIAPVFLTIFFPFIFQGVERAFSLVASEPDKNLFLRIVEGTLKTAPAAKGVGPAVKLGKGQMLEFGSFLAQKELIVDARWEDGELRLALPTVRPCLKFVYYQLGRMKRSEMMLRADGTVHARTGMWDEETLGGEAQPGAAGWAGAEAELARVVEADWKNYREENAGAMLAVSETPADAPKPPRRTILDEKEAAAQWRGLEKRLMVAGGGVCVFLVAVYFLAG